MSHYDHHTTYNTHHAPVEHHSTYRTSHHNEHVSRGPALDIPTYSEPAVESRVSLTGIFREFAGHKGYMTTDDLIRFYQTIGCRDYNRDDAVLHYKYTGITKDRISEHDFGRFVHC